MPSKSDGAAQAIKPVWTKPYVHTLKNAMGLTMETVTLVAAFPCEVVTPGNDVVIIRENSRLSKKSYRLSIKKELLKWR